MLKALYNIYSRGGKLSAPDMSESIPRRVVYSIRDKSLELLTCLKQAPQSLSELYSRCHSKSEVVATFVSVLELCSMGSIEISRSEESYMLSFVGGNIDEIMEKIVE